MESRDFRKMRKDDLVAELERLYQPKGDTITHSRDCCPYFRQMLKDENQEHFMALFLDGANRVISKKVIFIGTANRSLVNPRELFYHAVKENAVSIVIGHNHPSGNKLPSDEDFDITRKLLKASEIMGIEILDHVIVTATEHYSFHGNGKI